MQKGRTSGFAGGIRPCARGKQAKGVPADGLATWSGRLDARSFRCDIDLTRLTDNATSWMPANNDIQWNNIVQLELVPHPNNVSNPETLEAEFDLVQGVLRVQARAALVGYLLKRMSVDCSDRHRLRGPSYQWWLKNHPALYGLSNLDLAPGYIEPKA